MTDKNKDKLMRQIAILICILFIIMVVLKLLKLI